MSKKLEIGVIVGLSENPNESFQKVSDLGLKSCQLYCFQPELLTKALGRQTLQAAKDAHVRVSSFWAGYSGELVWNFLQGPSTIGLVPRATRKRRLQELKRGADFASWIGAASITTHVGFIPEDPNDPDYTGLIPVLRTLAIYCRRRGLNFCFETGQETPVTLLRTIHDIGTDNLGVNLDPANLILYGKGNPVDALRILGRFTKGMHAKDGLYPTDGRELGREVPLGKGDVNFPVLMSRLKKLGFAGPVTIEREISGSRQIRDIKKAIEFLRPLV